MSSKSSKNGVLGAVIVGLVLFGGYFFYKNNANEKQPEEPEVLIEEPIAEEKLIDLSLVNEKKYKTPTAYATFDVTYPQFKNVPADFNERIEELVYEGLESHKKSSSDNWNARYETRSEGDNISEFPPQGEKYPYSVSWEPAQINNNNISFLLLITGFSGGAHGYQSMASFNYDVNNQTEIELSDLFPNDPNYLKNISASSIKDLSTQFRKKLEVKTKQDEENFKSSLLPMIEMGTAPNKENFSIFTFTPTTITLYFSEYQVAPYSMGTSKITIKR